MPSTSQKLKLAVVVGTRPNFMKAASLVRASKARDDVDIRVIHTGQHTDPAMSDTFLKEFGLEDTTPLEFTNPDRRYLFRNILRELPIILTLIDPDLVVVVGDVDSSLAAALAAHKAGIPVAHVEAGLRSLDMTMPEERNRIAIDSLSSLHFVTEKSGVLNLRTEGVYPAGIHLVGNTMIDTLIHALENKPDVQVEDYILLTMHRPSNVDSQVTLNAALRQIVKIPEVPIVFPVHPRTKAASRAMDGEVEARIRFIDPCGYSEFIDLMRRARLVITDSGGVQEETTYLGIPCLTLRDNTERPVTIEEGTNQLVGKAGAYLPKQAQDILSESRERARPDIHLWDGKAGERIIDILVRKAKELK